MNPAARFWSAVARSPCMLLRTHGPSYSRRGPMFHVKPRADGARALPIESLERSTKNARSRRPTTRAGGVARNEHSSPRPMQIVESPIRREWPAPPSQAVDDIVRPVACAESVVGDEPRASEGGPPAARDPHGSGRESQAPAEQPVHPLRSIPRLPNGIPRERETTEPRPHGLLHERPSPPIEQRETRTSKSAARAHAHAASRVRGRRASRRLASSPRCCRTPPQPRGDPSCPQLRSGH